MTDAIVRVLAYNVHAFKDDQDALVRVICAVRPDVVCLQEVPRHPFSGHRISALAQACGLLWSGGERSRMSTTLLVGLRLDVLASGHRLLPVPRPAEPRGWAYARVRLPGHQPFTAASLHLSLKAGERVAHAAAVRKADELATSHRLVLAGDINETSEGPAWKALGADLDDPVGDLLSFPAKAPRKRIDSIFASPGLRARRVELEVDPADLVAASDHLPLAVDLQLSATY